MSKEKIALLIDGDPFAFAGASMSEVVHNWDGIYVNTADIQSAFSHATSHIDSIAKQLKADVVINTLSCPSRNYWRHDVMPSYKGGRKEYKGPICLPDLKEMLTEHYETEKWDTFEADDVMGILATDPTYLPDHKKIIVSIDKDMKTIPDTWIYNPDKDYQPWYNSKLEADHFFLCQAIGGDVTDGYSGVNGISVDGAATFLAAPWLWENYEHTFKSGPRKGESEYKWRKVDASSCLWTNIVSLYSKAGQSERDAIVNAQVARICRANNYDKDTGKVILWTPKQL